MSLVKARLKNLLVKARHGRRALPPAAAANLAALDGLDPAAPAEAPAYVVVDLETTGLDPLNDRVVAVGAVRLIGGRVRLGEHFAELVNPGRGIPAEAVKIHGITPDMIAAARPPAAVFADFLAFLAGGVLVAHYAAFDLNFINRTMQGLYGFPLQNLVLDTVKMCRALVLPSDPYGIERHRQDCSLEALAARFGLPPQGRHTALGDALTTAMILQRLLGRLAQVGPGTLREVLRVAALW
ncbi:MAG: 3'-5' exonuclease [Pseudomonadota bacterium]